MFIEPIRVIRTARQETEAQITPPPQQDDDNVIEENKIDRDEFGYPKAKIERILKYYQDHPDDSGSPENFVIIAGSDTYDSLEAKVSIFDIAKYNIKDVIATELVVIFHSFSGVCYCVLPEAHSWIDRLTGAKEGSKDAAFPITFSLDDPVERVVAREDVLFVTKSGKMIFWTKSDCLEFDESKFDEKIIDFALGDGHIVFLSESGNLYGYGSNTSGQLGADVFHNMRHTKFNISHIPERIVKVYATYNTTLVLTESGKVYSCGDSSYAAHGHKYSENYERTQLVKINFPHSVVDISTGLFFVSLKTNRDEYYVFGYNNMGQFGRSPTIVDKIEGPQYLDTFPQEKIDKLSCGGYHSSIVTTDKRVYVSGWNLENECFPSKEMKYHFIDVNAILGRRRSLPSNIELFATSGLYYLLIYSKPITAKKLNFKKSSKICDVSFNFSHCDSFVEAYPTFMCNED